MHSWHWYTKQSFLSRIPGIAFFWLLLLPIVCYKIHPQIGLAFISFFIAFWWVKVFKSYFFLTRSFFAIKRSLLFPYAQTNIVRNDAKNLKHIILIPFYNEPYSIVEMAVKAFENNDYPHKENIIVVLCAEWRSPHAIEVAHELMHRLESVVSFHLMKIIHPDNRENEWKVKSANITYAMKEVELMMHLDPKNTFVSTIDADTVVEKNFLSVITHTFLNTEERDQAIFQYTPIYSNNWLRGHFFARIVAMNTTFWQMNESQNPEFFRNFAVYGMSLHCLQKSDYWDLYSIVEDGLQYWRSYFAWNGQFRVIPTLAVCHMDLVEDTNIHKTLRAQYKQLRRWSWGCSDIEYVVPEFAKRPNIPFREKFRKFFYLLFNHLFWSAGPIVLFYMSSIPTFFQIHQASLLIFTVPLVVSSIFTFLTISVAIPTVFSLTMMRKYEKFRPWDYFVNTIQWLLVPLLILTLFSIPAIESQMRLFFGRRLDSFDVTKKLDRT